MMSRVSGDISSVSLRLFHNWGGGALLYLFIAHTLSIYINQFLAIGMQESNDRNEIYVARGGMVILVNGFGINKNTIQLVANTSIGIVIAYSYTVVYNSKKINIIYIYIFLFLFSIKYND